MDKQYEYVWVCIDCGKRKLSSALLRDGLKVCWSCGGVMARKKVPIETVKRKE